METNEMWNEMGEDLRRTLERWATITGRAKLPIRKNVTELSITYMDSEGLVLVNFVNPKNDTNPSRVARWNMRKMLSSLKNYSEDIGEIEEKNRLIKRISEQTCKSQEPITSK